MGNNKTYRIKTNVGKDKYVHVNLNQDIDTFEILSLKIKREGEYTTHTSDYGVIVGRVLANEGFGIPNAKLAIFVAKKKNENIINSILYPYTETLSSNDDGVRYNLLPNYKETECYQEVGSFPSKRFVLDNDNYVEVFEEYYKYTTKTNGSGDYMFFGVPIGAQTIHMDLDISDCGVLSQRPYDFIYKGYTIQQFQNPNQFKQSTALNTLPQIFSQDEVVDVKPYWGDENNNTILGITRADININFKFEPTCVFIGSIFTDGMDNGLSRSCTPSKKMGKMSELACGNGRIEMIRKKIDGSVEEFQINGTELINGDGVWCYQIPMNLDYMITDEYGNLVPTDDPTKGIPTRTKVRFRISMEDNNSGKYFQAKVLVPNNPLDEKENEETFTFGTNTPEEEFRDLFWNNVYTIKSYIPRFQKVRNILFTPRTQKFSGIKSISDIYPVNPIPYNHIRIRFPFMYTIVCEIIKFCINIVKEINIVTTAVEHGLSFVRNIPILGWKPFKNLGSIFHSYVTLPAKLANYCESLEGTYLIPGTKDVGHNGHDEVKNLIAGTYRKVYKDEYSADKDAQNTSDANAPLRELYSEYEINNSIFPWRYKAMVSNNNILQGYVYYWKNNNTFYGRALVASREIDLNVKYDDPTDRTVSLYNFLFKTDDLTKDFIVLGQSSNITMDINDFIDNEIKGKLSNVFAVTQYGNTEATFQESEFGKSIIKTINSYKGTLLGGGFNDPTSYETLGGKVEGEDEEDGICLTSDESYFVSCIEMGLAEEYSVINFDFYNDWLNGSIYMPRWARKAKIRRISGKKIVRACSSDGRRKRKLYVGSIGDTRHVLRISNLIASKNLNFSRKKWDEGNVGKLGKTVLVQAHTTNLGDTVYYYKPYIFKSGSKFNAFATDIVLLGALSNKYNPYGIPLMTENLPTTSFKMPGDIASTNYIDSDNDDNYTSNGCASIDIIKNNNIDAMWEAYSNEGGLTKNQESEDNIPFTEEAGISWNYTGPNQVTENFQKGTSDAYSPGGHFLGLSCSSTKTITNVKTTYNLIRACEYGVSLSERETVPSSDGKEYVLVPNGFISKDNIYDHSYRAAFATMNSNKLKTTIDEETGYYKYDFSYLNPDNFEGGFSNYITNTDIKRGKWSYNGQINVEVPEGVVLTNSEEYESGHTYSRALESPSEDYIRFRYGIQKGGLGGTLSKKHVLTTSSFLSIPQYENSYYFYFGLTKNNTAIDALKKDYFSVCKKSEDISEIGTIIINSAHIDSTMDKLFSIVEAKDAREPFEIFVISDNEHWCTENNIWANSFYLKNIEGKTLSRDDNGYWDREIISSLESLVYPTSMYFSENEDNEWKYVSSNILSPELMTFTFSQQGEGTKTVDVRINERSEAFCSIDNKIYKGNANGTKYKYIDNDYINFVYNYSPDDIISNKFGVLISNENVTLNITSSDGKILSRIISNKTIEISPDDIIPISFSGTTGATIDTLRYDFKNGQPYFIGGTIGITSLEDIGQLTIELTKGVDILVYTSNSSEIITSNGYCEFPVTSEGEWGVKVKLGEDIICEKVVIVGANLNVSYNNTIKFNGIELNKRKWFETNGIINDVIKKHLTQYNKNFAQSINLTCEINGNNNATMIFLGQGEKLNTNTVDNIEYNRDVEFAASRGYSLDITNSHIPTIGCNTIERRNFEIGFYNKDIIYGIFIGQYTPSDLPSGIMSDAIFAPMILDILEENKQYIIRTYNALGKTLETVIGRCVDSDTIAFTPELKMANDAEKISIFELVEMPIYYKPQEWSIIIGLSIADGAYVDSFIKTDLVNVEGGIKMYINNIDCNNGSNIHEKLETILTSNVDMKFGEIMDDEFLYENNCILIPNEERKTNTTFEEFKTNPTMTIATVEDGGVNIKEFSYNNNDDINIKIVVFN